MSIATIARVLLLGALVFAFASVRAGAATPQQVDEALKKALDYLRKQQGKDGSWEGKNDIPAHQFGGATAIATYALLAGGDSPQAEHIQQAVKWLGNADMKGTYALGLRAQVWNYLKPTADVKKAARRDAELLLNSADAAGRWGYTTSRGGEHNSTTQYGVLGLWAAARMGFEVPGKFWRASEQGWYACQDPKTGGWAYKSVVPSPDGENDHKVRPSMVAAGLASLFIAQDYLRGSDGVRCQGNITNERIEAGLKWMSDRYDPKWSDLYLLYGIERVGVASGYKYFGRHDWYQLGAEALVKSQQSDGSWRYWAEGQMRIPGTAFAVFFLTRGRAPVVMNKLRYDFEPPPAGRKESAKDAANWNQRPRDAANVVRWMGETMERDLNWQVVNLDVGADDLLDAPLLYLSGDQALRLGADDKRVLKSYVEQGGIILGQADCGKRPFVTSFRELGKELFPGFDFRVLPAGHFVFNEQYSATKWKDKVAVEGMSNGVREMMLLIPSEDVAKSWQQRSTEQKTSHFQVASNIFLYAVDKANLRFKGETYVLKPDPKAKVRRTVKLARIRYGGNWDPEPGGWRRFGTHLLNAYGLGLNVETVRLGADEVATAAAPAAGAQKAEAAVGAKADAKAAAKPAPSAPNAAAAAPAEKPLPTSLKGYDVAHLTGTTAFQLTSAAREEIRRFVEGGGTLIVDAAGGASAFADAADQELFRIFNDDHKQLAQPLKASHAAYNLPASKVSAVGYRTFAREKLGNLRAPRVRGIAVKERTHVFFSREDLSGGLVGQHVDGIYGYDPNSALQLVSNFVLYATNEGNTPTTKPATEEKPAK